MDCHKILQLLLEFDKDTSQVINQNQLQENLDSIFSALPESIKKEIEQERNDILDSKSVGWQYLHLVSYIVKTLLNTEFSDENPLLTVDQFKVLKKTIKLITCIGILPCLSPQIKIHAATILSQKYELNSNDHNILEKYKILTHTMNILLRCFEKTILRPAIISQLECMIGALLQLAHAPLKKPLVQINASSETEFEMTAELYNKFKQEQQQYCEKLQELMNNCPQALLIKEFMLILGINRNPKWLQIIIKQYLTDRIMQSNGVISLVIAICDDISNLGNCWDKLDIAAQLVATSHGSDMEEYFDSVCSQILELLNSEDNNQKTIVANSCIKALYDKNPEICIRKVINLIMDPFLVKYKSEESSSNLMKTEQEVSQSIDSLYKLFITTSKCLPGAEFKCLPTKLLISIALPLFQLHIKSHQSIYVHRDKVRQLLLKILKEHPVRKSIFFTFLNYEELSSNELGEKLNFCFGNNGGFEIISDPFNIEHEKVADCLFDLVEKNECLSFDLFTCLLNIIPGLDESAQKVEKGILIETTSDTVERIEKQLSAMKLLTLLSSLSLVQKAQLENPEPFLNFIRFYFSKIISISDSSNQASKMSLLEQDIAVLYTCLMFIKIILTDNNIKKTWRIFQDFITSIKEDYDFKKVPLQIITIVDEIETVVKRKGRSFSNNSYDVSIDDKNLSEFEKAEADLADPLLPVRAHGIITLTKLIERRHPEVAVKKDFLLYIFQKNLDDDDSFIYLAAINGLCAMSSMFPDAVIEILVQEFSGITDGSKGREIPPETRTKLGEILVKTTRALGEMTPKYKNLLVNGFLSGTRDPDPLVRASSLSCLGEFCKIMGFRLGSLITEILYCIGCIIKTDKDDGCRRAGVLVATLLLKGLGKDALTSLGENLVTLYRSLKHLRDNDKDPTLQLHAQLAIDEFDDIVKKFLFDKPKLEKSIFLLPHDT